MYSVYWIISEDRKRTYIGFTCNVEKRKQQHLSKKVFTTKNFGKFSFQIIEQIAEIDRARIREKYWKSGAGRKKLKLRFMVPSSNG